MMMSERGERYLPSLAKLANGIIVVWSNNQSNHNLNRYQIISRTSLLHWALRLPLFP
jgi:hypothetical protein